MRPITNISAAQCWLKLHLCTATIFYIIIINSSHNHNTSFTAILLKLMDRNTMLITIKITEFKKIEATSQSK